MSTPDPAASLVQAAHVAAVNGMVDAFGHISIRLDDDTYLITAGQDLGTVTTKDVVTVKLTDPDRAARAPAEYHLHTAIYRHRPDALAICRAQPPEALPVGAVLHVLEPLHGQAAWLGRATPVHPDARLLRDRHLAANAVSSLGPAHAMVLRGNGAVTLGATPGLAVARMWILGAACRVWLQAAGSGAPTPLTPGEIRSWQTTQDELLPRLWHHLIDRACSSTGSLDRS